MAPSSRGYDSESEEARIRCQDEISLLIPALHSDASVPGGRSVFPLTRRSVPGKELVDQSGIAVDQLRPLLERKTAEALDANSATNSQESDECSEPCRLPFGFRFEARATQEEAFLRADLPQGLRNVGHVLQLGRVAVGDAALVYLRFPSTGARRQWLGRPAMQERRTGGFEES